MNACWWSLCANNITFFNQIDLDLATLESYYSCY